MFPLLLIGLATYLVLRGGATAQALLSAEVVPNLSAIRIGGTWWEFVTGTAPLLLPLSIRNTKPTPVRFGGFRGNVLLGESILGAITYTDPAMLPANGTLTIEVPVFVPLGTALSALADAIAAGPITLTIRGTLTVDGVGIPLNQNVPLATPLTA